MHVQISDQTHFSRFASEAQPRDGASLRLALLLLALNLLSAALFIARVNRPVYDDGFNIYDVHQYAVRGLSLDSLRSQRNAPGPTSFIWMSLAVRLIGGNELRDARIGAFLSWLLLGMALLFGARFSRNPELWYGALLALLVFPHAVEAASTVLTEGPALFFALVGALAWTEFVSRADSSATTWLCGMLGGLFLGLAVTCRQYNLALLPAAALVAAGQFRGRERRWAGRVLVSLALSAVPVLLLISVWKGIANPSIESGTSYNMMYKASTGLSLTRPAIALLSVCFYLIPLAFPLMLRVPSTLRWRMLAIAAIVGLAAGHWNEELLQPGPLNTILGIVGRALHSQAIPLGFVAAVAAYNTLALGLALWDQRNAFLSSPAAGFALLLVVFFVAEQFGVGGNIPFYDRYVLLVAPFLGVIAFAVLPTLDRLRVFVLIALSFLSHFVLWRNALSN